MPSKLPVKAVMKNAGMITVGASTAGRRIILVTARRIRAVSSGADGTKPPARPCPE